MQIVVYGLWHLGCVTAASLAEKGFATIGIDPNVETISALQQGTPPIQEPKLTDMIQRNLNKTLSFSHDMTAVERADVVWITFDTPVDENDHADVSFVKKAIEHIFPYLKNNTIVIISSQLPVGSTHSIANAFHALYPQKHVDFVYSPENLRLGSAVDYFLAPDRIVIGSDNIEAIREKLTALLAVFTSNIIWMKTTSAEMCKHALNAFLATSVTFINELASICEEVGANAHEVAQGLKSDFRIGKFAYLRPGEAFAGGTLARDIRFLNKISEDYQLPPGILAAIIDSNQHHSSWVQRTLTKLFNNNLSNKKIALLGLSYKTGTDTLRRSSAVELGVWLAQQGAVVTAFDASIDALPSSLAQQIQITHTLEAAITDCHAVVINKPDPTFMALSKLLLEKNNCQKNIIDAGAFLRSKNSLETGINYYVVGDKP